MFGYLRKRREGAALEAPCGFAKRLSVAG
jgi:hypothetical protein